MSATLRYDIGVGLAELLAETEPDIWNRLWSVLDRMGYRQNKVA